MKKQFKVRLVALGASFAVAASLAVAASGSTGAYFSDTKSGTITGSIGTIKVDTSNPNIAFTNLMPGEPQTLNVSFTNTGTNNQDVWVVFNNYDALHAINDLGTYGEVTITDSHSGQVFHSNNLNDRPNNGTTPLPKMVKLESNVANGSGGSMGFTFQYAGKLGNASQGGVFNNYPVAIPSDRTDVSAPTSPAGSSGLPYEIVATQVGQTPGA